MKKWSGGTARFGVGIQVSLVRFSTLFMLKIYQFLSTKYSKCARAQFIWGARLERLEVNGELKDSGRTAALLDKQVYRAAVTQRLEPACEAEENFSKILLNVATILHFFQFRYIIQPMKMFCYRLKFLSENLHFL